MITSLIVVCWISAVLIHTFMWLEDGYDDYDKEPFTFGVIAGSIGWIVFPVFWWLAWKTWIRPILERQINETQISKEEHDD